MRRKTPALPGDQLAEGRRVSGKGVIVVGRFTSDGMGIPCNTLLAGKARRAEKEN
jgi:hypothetical protein